MALDVLLIHGFRFKRHIGSVIQRAFVDFCRGFEFSLHQSERQAAFFTIDKGGAGSFYNFGKQVLCAMTPCAFVNFYLCFKLSLDHEQVKPACFAIDQRGAFSLFHLCFLLAIELDSLFGPANSTFARSRSGVK